MLKSHTLVPERSFELIRHELRPARDLQGRAVPGLYNTWIALDNPSELNSYTTDIAKEIILALRQASMDRRVVACVLTGTGDKAFCTGGNTREYAAWLQMLLEGRDPVEGSESLDTAAIAIEEAYLGLRTSNGLGLNPANAGDFGRWQDRGWATVDEERGYLTPTGWLRLDSLVADLTDVRSR